MGFVYCSGFFNNQAVFGNDTLKNSNLGWGGNNKENFVFKIDSFGTVLWAKLREVIFLEDVVMIETWNACYPWRMYLSQGTFWSSYNLGPLSVPGSQQNAHDNSLLAQN